MKTLLSNERDLASLVLRIGFGFFIVFGHGLGKLQMLISGDIQFMSMFGLSPTIVLVLVTFAEFFAGLAVLVGFKTRLAAIPVIFAMAVAGFIFHFNDPWFYSAADGQGAKEMALLFFTGFLGIFFIGSGKYSLDYLISKK